MIFFLHKTMSGPPSQDVTKIGVSLCPQTETPYIFVLHQSENVLNNVPERIKNYTTQDW